MNLSHRWIVITSSAKRLLSTTLVANTLSVLALALAGYSLQQSSRSESQRRTENVWELRERVVAANRQAHSDASKAVELLDKLIEEGVSAECKAQAAALRDHAKTQAFLATTTRDSLNDILREWRERGGQPRQPPTESDVLPTDESLASWLIDGEDARSAAAYVLDFSIRTVEECRAGRSPPLDMDPAGLNEP